MPSEATIFITQYAPEGGYSNLNDMEIGVPGTSLLRDSIGNNSSSMSMYSLLAVQNPSPSSGRESSYATVDEDRWSDSPYKDPTRSDTYRYAYGRFGEGRYRNLDNYAGTVLHDRIFSRAGNYLQQDHVFNGSYLMIDSDYSESGNLLMQDHTRISGDATINQYNFLVSASPVPFSYKNSVDTDVSIRLSNYVYPLDTTAVELYINGVIKTPLEITPFYTGLGGFDAKWYNDQEFNYNEQISVEWRVFDTDSPANEIVFRYWFRTVADFIGPRISGLSPAANEVNVSVDTCILFTLRDYELGINITTLELYVNNIFISNDEMVITETSTSDGYNILYCPDDAFMYGDTIAVSIYVEDLAEDANYLFHVYSFSTEQSLPPVVVGNSPLACREYVFVDKDVEVDIIDGGQGLDEDSIRVDVDEISTPLRKRPIIYRGD